MQLIISNTRLIVLLGLCFFAIGSLHGFQSDDKQANSISKAMMDDPEWLLPVSDLKIDSSIPDSELVLGFDWAEDISNCQQIEQYFKALVEAAPNRTRLVQYGTSYEGRKLHYLIISSPENITRLDQIQADIKALADPRTCRESQADEIIKRIPAILWMGYCVHGNEPSVSDAAMITAWHLLADQRPETAEVLKNLVVIIDPLQNPDGRERFVNAYREKRGVFPQSYPIANEHTERWPLGRTNHYWFDMNRDWFRQSQKESRAKIAAYLDWHPQIFTDSHEFQLDNTYYFSPPADPKNPHILPQQLEWMNKLGAYQGSLFDRHGFTYTTREIFDAFYPGYGSEWPTMQGGIGVLWEQASARGLVIDRPDQTQLTYVQGVRHNYISGLATLEFAAKNSKELLKGFYDTRRRAVDSGTEGTVQHYFILKQNPQRADKLARLLVQNGIEVRRLDKSVRTDVFRIKDGTREEMEIPVGSYHVAAAQGAGRLLRTLMDRNTPMDPDYLQRQIEKSLRKEKVDFKDVSSWSLPLSFDLDCLQTGALEVNSSLWDGKGSAYVDIANADVAYAIPESDGAIRMMSAMLQRDIRVHVTSEPFRIYDRDFPRGTLLVKTPGAAKSLHNDLKELAREFEVEVVPINSGYVQKGAHFGGPEVAWVKPPRILLVVDDPMDFTCGHTWHLFDEVLKYPTTRIRSWDFPRTKLSDFDTIILPHGKYKDAPYFDKKMGERLTGWVSEGGTLITVGGGTDWAAGPDIKLIKNGIVKQKVTLPGTRKEGEQTTEVPPEKLLGAFFGSSVAMDHWITVGYKPTLNVFYTGQVILTPTGETEGRSLVSFNKKEDLVTSGFCWPASQELLAESPYLVVRNVERGFVIAFVDDPNFRGMYPGLQRLFINAAMFGPGQAIPLVPGKPENE